MISSTGPSTIPFPGADAGSMNRRHRRSIRLATRVVSLHPLTLAQNARTSGGGNITMVPSQAITVGPVETWKADRVSIWHAGTHDNPSTASHGAHDFGKRIVTAPSRCPCSRITRTQLTTIAEASAGVP